MYMNVLYMCVLCILVYVCVCMSICICVYHVCSDACGDQGRVLDPLELELRMVVSPHVTTGN